MRHMAKRAMSLLLALLLCLALFPAAALAEEGSISSVEDEGDGLSGTPAPTEEDEPGTIAGDGVIDVPTDDPAALPLKPAADEIQSIVASGTCGENLTWTLDDTGLLTISGTGEMADWEWFNYCDSPWYRQRMNINEIKIEHGVTTIGDIAFYDFKNLTRVTIPESVTSIGEAAFFGCISLTIIAIPESVTSIKEAAFYHCSSLLSVTIPAGVISIGVRPFAFCESLKEILVAEGNISYVTRNGVLYDANILTLLQCPGGMIGAMTIPESVNSIGTDAFQGCGRLSSVTIPTSITNIGDAAFSACSSLESIRFLGNSPEIYGTSFYIVRATALYPIDNPTWTADKLQDYGAEKLTWVGYRDEAKAYTIHFDPNGGSDAPEDQVKGHNVDITLTDAVPGRENAAFLGWSTRRGAAQPDYLPGDRFGLNADTTLYAVWKQEAPVLPTEAVLSLGSVKVCAGQEFTVELTMEKNPGLMYLSFRLDYDTASLEFLGAEDGLFTGWTVNKEKNFLAWDADGDRTENGTLLRLRFQVKEDAATGETAIALADLFATNFAEDLLGIGGVSGTVTILPHTPGDVNGDGEIDGRDLIRMRKYLVGIAGTEIVEANTNVNGDDVIDILDLVRLRKFLAQYDVILE